MQKLDKNRALLYNTRSWKLACKGLQLRSISNQEVQKRSFCGKAKGFAKILPNGKRLLLIVFNTRSWKLVCDGLQLRSISNGDTDFFIKSGGLR